MTLFTSEQPLWELISPRLSFCNDLPAWTDPTTSWFTALAFSCAPPIVFRLTEGGWWMTFKWLQSLLSGFYLSFLVILQSQAHQSYRHDIRLWLPVSIDIAIPGCRRYSTSLWHRPQKVASPCQHHQYGIRLRLRPKVISLQYGYNLLLPPGYEFMPIRKILKNFKKRCRPQKLATPEVPSVHFASQLYDRTLRDLESRLYLNQKDHVTVT